MAQAVAKGGIKVIEITWNSEQPAKLVQQLRRELPHCTIGAGTILTIAELEEAIAFGAEFIFSPHLNLTLVEASVSAQIPMIPGALTPTEIINAWQAGASCVKVFPITSLGGSQYLRAIKAPLAEIPLIPTGGVTLGNARNFLAAGAIAIGLSSDLFPANLVREQNWLQITQRAKTLVESLKY